MTKEQAIVKAQELAFSRTGTSEENRTKHIELRQLFNDFKLNWNELKGVSK